MFPLLIFDLVTTSFIISEQLNEKGERKLFLSFHWLLSAFSPFGDFKSNFSFSLKCIDSIRQKTTISTLFQSKNQSFYFSPTFTELYFYSRSFLINFMSPLRLHVTLFAFFLYVPFFFPFFSRTIQSIEMRSKKSICMFFFLWITKKSEERTIKFCGT